MASMDLWIWCRRGATAEVSPLLGLLPPELPVLLFM